MLEERFKNESINKLFLKLVIPNMVGMAFVSMYMMIDAIFIGRFIGSDALAAVNFVMPFIMITYSIGDLLAIGSSVKISIALGEGNHDYANKAFTTILLLVVSLGFVLSIVGTIAADNLLPIFIKDKNLLHYASEYMKVMVFMMPFVMPMFVINNYLRVCGKPNYSMVMSIVAAVSNLVLDYLFIVKLDLGIQAAAFATTIGMSMCTVIGIIPFILKKVSLRFTKKLISLKEIVAIAYNGSSEFFNNISGSIMSIIVNGLLLNLGGATAVAIYGMITYVDSMIISLIYGMLDALQPAISYNVGAKNIEKTKEILKKVMMLASVACIGFMIILISSPETVVGLFLDKIEAKDIEIAQNAIMLYAPSYLFVWFNMISSSFLTSLDRPKESLMIMMSKSVVFPILTLLVTVSLFKVNGIYVAPAISNFLTVILAFNIWKKIKSEVFATNISITE